MSIFDGIVKKFAERWLLGKIRAFIDAYKEKHKMDSADKQHWWEKKVFWGTFFTVLFYTLSKFTLPGWAVVPVQILQHIAEALGVYGGVEVVRSLASNTKAAAQNTQVITPPKS